jgi:hypothetical protein
VTRSTAWLLSIALAGCGSTEAKSDAPSGGTRAPIPVAGSRCNAVVQQHAIEPSDHVAECSAIVYGSNPPSSGPHYGTWAAYAEYTVALPRGYWVHNLEHGTVVIGSDCEGGCDPQWLEAADLARGLPIDEFCLRQGLSRPRVILTVDPLLDSRWAASAWGFTLRADCFEPEVFRDFYSAHVGKGPENICAPGSTLGDGSFPADCGR